MKKGLLVISVLLLAISACSYNVPLRHELAVESPPAVKNEKILVVMSKEQAEKIIEYSPQVGDTYVFEAGPALKDLTLHVLGQCYREVSYAESADIENVDYDRAIEVALQDYEIVMNIYTGNEVKLNIDYTIYNQKGGVTDRFSTNTSSKERYSGSDYVGTFIVGAFYNIGKMKEQIGGAWDAAAINSIGELVDRLAGGKMS